MLGARRASSPAGFFVGGRDGWEEEGRRQALLMGRPAKVAIVAGPAPTLSFRFKRLSRMNILQQAWRHPDGLEWRNVETVPAEAPDWESRDAPPAPPGR